MPKILERAVSQIKARGVPEGQAYAIATASMQKAGNMKGGKATAKGTARGKMTPAERAKDRAGGKGYKYNKFNNSAVKGKVNPNVKKRK